MLYKNLIRLIMPGLILSIFITAAKGANQLATEVNLDIPVTQNISATTRADSEQYPYKSPNFDLLVGDSYRACNAGIPQSFYIWMDKAYNASRCKFPGKKNMKLSELLIAEKQELNGISNISQRTQAEIRLGGWLYKLIKNIIPMYSLDRGFEFCNAAARRERQCFLQSILISSLLQSMDVDAGVVMVYKNPEGKATNNGHAITLIKLSDGRDIIVDASHPKPFIHQRGLFVRTTDYIYVNPVYMKNTDKIIYYKSASGSRQISTNEVKILDYDFLRSQFWYYRGERAKGGLLARTKTKLGLNASASALRKSIEWNSRNPLSVYMLGKVYYSQGSISQARAQFQRAVALYSKYGWVPTDPKKYLKLTSK